MEFDNYTKIMDLRQVLDFFIRNDKPFPPSSELASKIDIPEEHVTRLICEYEQQKKIMNEYKVKNILDMYYKTLIKENMNPDDYSINKVAIAACIEKDNTCCSCKLSKDFNIPEERIDNMKSDIEIAEIRSTKINNIINDYRLA